MEPEIEDFEQHYSDSDEENGYDSIGYYDYYDAHICHSEDEDDNEEDIKRKFQLARPPGDPLGRVRWQPCLSGHLPPGAIHAGKDEDGTPLFVGRAEFHGDLLPGKVKPNNHGIYVPWGGGEHWKRYFEVLVGSHIKYKWEKSSDGNVPPNAFAAGFTDYGETLYIARAQHEGTITPGKVHPSHKCMYLSYDYKEFSKKEYEVLVLI